MKKKLVSILIILAIFIGSGALIFGQSYKYSGYWYLSVISDVCKGDIVKNPSDFDNNDADDCDLFYVDFDLDLTSKKSLDNKTSLECIEYYCEGNWYKVIHY